MQVFLALLKQIVLLNRNNLDPYQLPKIEPTPPIPAVSDGLYISPIRAPSPPIVADVTAVPEGLGILAVLEAIALDTSPNFCILA